MELKKRKILFLSAWYPNRNAPTHGIFVKRHAEAAALHNKVAVLHVCSDAIMKARTIDLTVVQSENVYTVVVYYKKVVATIPVLSVALKTYRYLLAYGKGWKWIRKNFGRPDLIHLNVLFPIGIVAWFFKKRYRVPYVASEHWTGYFPEDGNYKGFFRKLITKIISVNAAGIAPVSSGLKNVMVANNIQNEQYVIIPNVVETNLFVPLQKTEAQKKIRILHVSGLDDRQKNVSGILDAVKQLYEKRKDFELRIIGDGTDRNKLEKYAKDFGLLNSVVFFDGMKLGKQLADFMQASDFLVSFSNYESFSAVIAEALSSGVPVVTTNLECIMEYFTAECGLTVGVGDTEALKKAMNKMLDNYRNYDAEKIRQVVADKFTFEKVGKQFDDWYKEVLSR